VEIVVQVSDGTARALRGDAPPTDESREIEDVAVEAGVKLVPLHPESDDPSLACYLITEVSDEAAAEVAAALTRSPGVESVFAKPAGEPPG
jgi:hypothetical protein